MESDPIDSKSCGLFRIVLLRSGHEFAQQRFEEFQWFGVIVRIETVLVVVFAEIDRILVPLVVFKLIPDIAITTTEMGVVVQLEQAVVLDDPVDFLRYERPQDGGCHFTVRVGRELVADIV